MNWLAVMAGSAIGGALRYAIGSAWIRSGALGFPWGILVVNVTGSLALGFLARYFAPPHASHATFLFVSVGLCGGYTTFSTFSLDTFTLVQGGAVGRALVYVLASIVLSYLALAGGYALARPLHAV